MLWYLHKRRGVIKCDEGLLCSAWYYFKGNQEHYEQEHKGCINDDCSFKIHAVVLVDKCTWMIMSLTEGHKCPNTQFNKNVSSRWVAFKLLDDFKDILIWIKG